MSHLKERPEKVCLNCGANTHGLYCHKCGQENIEPKIGIGHLLVHFFNDVTHFDGKLFSTAKLLLFKPGYLSAEYMKGRRVSYLDPIRMYLFISATFFLIFFMLQDSNNARQATHYTPEQQHYIDSERTVMQQKTMLGLSFEDNKYDHSHTIKAFTIPPKYRPGVHVYDSIQNTLPPAKRDGWLERYITRRFIATYKKYEQDPDKYWDEAGEHFFHSLSKVVFITLPIFILLLGLLYIRRRKEYFLVSHSIFALHIYAVTFIWLLALLLTGYLPDPADSILAFIIITGMLIYAYLAMLRFYKQGWFKTLMKFLLLMTTSVVMLTVLTLLFLMNSYLNMAS